MTTIPAIYDGMRGNHAIDTIQMSPLFGFSNNGLVKPITKLNHGTLKVQPDSMEQTVLLTNSSGARGVKPCKGNLESTRVLRRPTVPYQQALYPHTGIARHQKIGLVYDPAKPINQPIMPIADSFNAGLKSRFPVVK